VNKRALNQVTRIVLVQCLVMGGISFLLGYSYHTLAAYSALVGGVISIVPNAVFGLILCWYNGARYTEQIMTAFYMGEAAKWFMVIGLFIVTFVWLPLTPVAVLVGFVGAQVIFWLASLQQKLD
jgi:ATP synthase protein I